MKYSFTRASLNPGYAIVAESDRGSTIGVVGYASTQLAALWLIANGLKAEL